MMQMKMRETCVAVAALAAAVLASGSALAQGSDKAPEMTPREQLSELMMSDEKAHMTALQTARAKANSEEDFKRSDRLKQNIDTSAAAYRTEHEAVISAMDSLSDEQVDTLVKALSTVKEHGVNLDIDADALKQVNSAQYGNSGIEGLVSAYEETKDLSAKAEKLTLQAEVSGDEDLLRQAEKAHDQAVQKRQELIEKGKDL